MDIAALSMIMSHATARQDVSVGLMRKSLNQAEESSNGLLKLLNSSTTQASHPTLGNSIDLKA